MFTSRRREHPASIPYSYALISRDEVLRPRERYRDTMEIGKANIMSKQDIITRGRCEWEEHGERSTLDMEVKKKMEEVFKADQVKLLYRQERLLKLLQSEEEGYFIEIENMEETMLDRKAKMREKAQILREKREKNRLAVVEEKLEQKFRQECDELRSLNFQRNEMQIAQDRKKQVEMKQKIHQNDLEYEKFQDQLMLKDVVAKERYLEMEKMANFERKKEILEGLNQQMKLLEEKKQQAEELKKNQAVLLEEQANITKMEEQQELIDKQLKQKEVRKQLDHSICLTLKRKADELKKEMEYNLKLMKEIETETRDEELGKVEKKNRLMKEQRQYLKYVNDELAKDKVRELELEQIVQEDLEKQIQKSVAAKQAELEKRQKLMKDVIKTIEEQIQDRIVQNQRLQEEILIDAENMKKKYEEMCAIDAEKEKKRQEIACKYKQDLLGQIAYDQQQSKMIEEFTNLELQKQHEEERKYNKRVADTLASTRTSNIHPARALFSNCPE